MGCCAIRTYKNSKTSATTVSLTKNLNTTKDSILSQIFFLHNLNLECCKEIETSILEQKRGQALILTEKRMCIKNKLKDLQELMSKIDEFIEGSFMNIKIKQNLEIMAKEFVEEIQNNLIFDKEVQIDGRDEWYLERLKKEIKNYNLDEQKMEKEIENDIRKQIKTGNENQFIRRKYKKARTVNND